jgi:hypothetical protein
MKISLPTENQIFMACLDAHLYEIEYKVPVTYSESKKTVIVSNSIKMKHQRSCSKCLPSFAMQASVRHAQDRTRFGRPLF